MKYLRVVFFVLPMASLKAQTQTGKASFYSNAFEGIATANGEKYRAKKLTAAHKTLPFGTLVKVTNLANNESVNVTINDRGPYVEGRIIDLSLAAAERLRFINQGTAEVRIEILEGTDEKKKNVIAARGASEEKEFYDFDVRKVQPKGFGAQVGTFQELGNLFHIASNLTSTYKKKAVVQIKVIKGIKHYGLILGPFSTQAKAESFVSGLKKQFPDAFVLDYAKL